MKKPASSKAGNTIKSDLRKFARLVRGELPLIVLCTALTLVFGFYYLLRTPRVYKAEAVIQVEQEERSVVALDGVKAEDLKAQEVIKTIEQNLMSPGLLTAVIEHNKLAADGAFLPQLKRPATIDLLQRELGKEVSAKVRQGTRLIDLEVDDRSPEMARRIAELVLQEYMREGFQGQVDAGQMAHEFLVKEAKRLKEKLDGSAQALQNYLEQTASVSLEDKQNIIAEKLKELNTRVTEAKSNRLKLEADCAQLQNPEGRSTAELLAVPSVASSGAVLDLKKSISDKEAQIATLMERYKPQHPKYIAAVTELAQLRGGLRAAAIQGAVQVVESYKAAVATENKLADALKDQEGIALDLGRKLLTYNALNGEVQADRALYDSMLKRLKESDVLKGVGQNEIRIVSNPTASERPISPRRGKVLLMSLLGGLAFGCGTGIARKTLQSTVGAVEDGESELEIPCFGYIPHCGRLRVPEEALVVANDPGSHAAEAFRSLRTSLTLNAKHGDGGQVILFTSAVPDEGKTFCAINCALAFAQQGLKTLLVDADLRMPSVGRLIFGEESVTGLTDIVACRLELQAAIRDAGMDGLQVLCAGSRIPRMAELLGTPPFRNLLAELRNQFDRIVIDSAPVCPVSDTLLILSTADAVCLVVRANKTPLHVVLEAERALGDSGAMNMGFVLNGSKERKHHYYDAAYASCYQGGTRDSALGKASYVTASAAVRSRNS